tara:strand:+ start:9454 stop:9984 length:531 start_codon:yes stop_codon:yes gene_type:complete
MKKLMSFILFFFFTLGMVHSQYLPYNPSEKRTKNKVSKERDSKADTEKYYMNNRVINTSESTNNGWESLNSSKSAPIKVSNSNRTQSARPKASKKASSSRSTSTPPKGSNHKYNSFSDIEKMVSKSSKDPSKWSKDKNTKKATYRALKRKRSTIIKKNDKSRAKSSSLFNSKKENL